MLYPHKGIIKTTRERRNKEVTKCTKQLRS